MHLSRSSIVFATLGCLTCATAALEAQAAPTSFTVQLSGAEQAPPVKSSGTGTASLTYDPASRALAWSITYTGLSSPVTMAHFHGPAAAGKNAPPVIWISKRGSAVASPIKGKATLTPAQAKEFAAGEWYVNVHTKDHPAGEIRGQATPPKS